MRRAVAVAACLWSAAAAAVGPQTLEGTSRISVVGGWRYTDNELFASRAEAAGTPVVDASPGGPQLTATFGYSAKEILELTIDLFAGAEQLELVGRGKLSSVTYGGVVGVRLQTLLGERFVPSLGIHTGPTLIYLRGGGLTEPSEKFTNSYAASAALTYRLDEHWGIHADARFLIARGVVPGLLSINGGGLWGGVGVTYTFGSDGYERGRSGLGW